MAEVLGTATDEQRERRMFAGMAIVIAATVLVGFSSYSLRGLVPQPVPLLIHLHALLFGSWVLIFVVQTTLIQRNSYATHRTVGWASVVVAAAMVIVGPMTAVESVRLHRVPPFFPDGIFLALSFLEIACFAALFVAAMILRRRTDWHRRLMLGTMLAVIGPAWGRILPMMSLGPFGGIAIMVILLVFYLGAAAAFDLRTQGKMHPAHYYSALAVLIEGIGPGPLGMSPLIANFAAALSSG